MSQNTIHKTLLKQLPLALCMAGLCALPVHAEDKGLGQIRQEIKEMRAAYEARMAALEQKLAEAEAKNAQLQAQVSTASQSAQAAQSTAQSAADAAEKNASQLAADKPKGGNINEFNPAIALNLTGTMANLSQDPEQYRIQGLLPSKGEISPGKRGFSLGESELGLVANVDPHFSGQLTFSLDGEGAAEVEEAWVQTRALGEGLRVRAGRMLSGIGYLNSQHAHVWDFVDAPLAYRAFFGGQYRREGVQLTWLAPSERFLEFGMELGNGGSYPGTTRNKNGFGDAALYAHIGDDWGDNASWKLGLSLMRNHKTQIDYTDTDLTSALETNNSFKGDAKTLVLDGVWKWAADGKSFKLSGEYLRRNYDGLLSYSVDPATVLEGDYHSRHHGWYLQGVYQFAPQWRIALRHEGLSGSQNNGLLALLSPAQMATLQDFKPRKTSLALDYVPSEFSRLRLQFGHEQAQDGRTDRQIFLQYNMSLGAHPAHSY